MDELSEFENDKVGDMVDKCVWVVPDTVDKSIGTETHSKSVRTQYNPLDLIDITDEEIIENHPPVTPVLKVKFTTPESREKHTNTELTFPPFAHITFHNAQDIADEQMLSDQAESEAEDFEVNTDPLYNPVSDSETDEEADNEPVSPISDNIFFNTQTTPLTEPKFLVFWSCLVTLCQFCFTCFKKTTITKVITRGALLVVKMNCPNNHKHRWTSQPIIKGSGAGNLLLSASILFSGNTYVRIEEMFNIINFLIFSKTIIKSRKQFCTLH